MVAHEGFIISVNVPYFHSEEEKKRPAFVLEIDEGSGYAVVAYCTSQKATGTPLKHEVIMGEGEYQKVGLNKPTRIDMSRRVRLPIMDIEDADVIGNPMNLGTPFVRKLAHACSAAGYL